MLWLHAKTLVVFNKQQISTTAYACLEQLQTNKTNDNNFYLQDILCLPRSIFRFDITFFLQKLNMSS